MRTLTILLVAILAPGCSIYFGGGGDDDDCATAEPAPPGPSTGHRDPYTGECVYWGGGGGGGPICGGDRPHAASGDSFEAPGAPPDWATCESACTGLDESTCQASDGCRAIYVDTCAGTDLPCIDVRYDECWATAPAGPVRGGSCSGLDPEACSLHDDCVAVHMNKPCSTGAECPPTPGQFISCQDEADPMPVECSALSEPSCIERSDCAPLYLGSDCSCGPDGCSCNQDTFVGCVDRAGGVRACGPLTCSGDQYCEKGIGGAPPGVENYACKPLPETCGANPSCDGCLANEPCAEFSCERDAATGTFTLTCFYP